MAVRAIGLLALLGCLTVFQQGQWASDVALWAAAVDVNRVSPRPAFNLGLALRKQGRFDRAAYWLAEAGHRATGTQAEDEYRARIDAQIMAMEMTGTFTCDSSLLRPYCSR